MLLCSAVLSAQGSIASNCSAGQEEVLTVGFNSFDCEGCRLRRDAATGVALLEFSKPPVLTGLGNRGGLRDGDRLLQVDGLSILARAGAQRLASLGTARGADFLVERNGRETAVNLRAARVCQVVPRQTVLSDSLWRRFINRDTSARPSGIGIEYPRLLSAGDSGWSPGALTGYSTWSFPDRLSDSSTTFRAYALAQNRAAGAWEARQWNRVERAAGPRGWLGFALGCDSCFMVSSRKGTLTWDSNPASYARVVQVDATGPSARAGLRIGDVILSIDGVDARSPAFAGKLADLAPGDTVVVRYSRGADTVAVPLAAVVLPSTSWPAAASLRLTGQLSAGTLELEFSGAGLTVTEDPRTGVQTITGDKITIVIKPPRSN
jgi:membrane-associated protease RseP (regulator of RpoE activity)